MVLIVRMLFIVWLKRNITKIMVQISTWLGFVSKTNNFITHYNVFYWSFPILFHYVLQLTLCTLIYFNVYVTVPYKRCKLVFFWRLLGEEMENKSDSETIKVLKQVEGPISFIFNIPTYFGRIRNTRSQRNLHVRSIILGLVSDSSRYVC